MSSSSGGNSGEDARGYSLVSSAKSAIKVLSSGRFLTPSSSARTMSLDDRKRPEETSRDFFADGLPFAMGTDDVEVSGPEIVGVYTQFSKTANNRCQFI
jgi:hypothetical protein